MALRKYSAEEKIVHNQMVQTRIDYMISLGLKEDEADKLTSEQMVELARRLHEVPGSDELSRKNLEAFGIIRRFESEGRLN